MNSLPTESNLLMRPDSRSALHRAQRPVRVEESGQGGRLGRSPRQVQVVRSAERGVQAPAFGLPPAQGDRLPLTGESLSTFDAQVLGQDETPETTADARKRQAVAGVTAYRKAGETPDVHVERASLFSVDI